MKLGLASLSVLLALSLGPAKAETPLFPQSKITLDQWQDLFGRVQANPERHPISRPDIADVVVFEIASEKSAYYFTKSGPAYPAVAIAHLVEGNDKVYLEKRGYFAGDEAEFAKWFKALAVAANDLPDVVGPRPPQ